MAYRVKAYTLREESTESGTRYFISFKDGQGKSHELEVSEQFFMEFRQMERRNRNLLQWDERHREFSEVWDETLNRRALKLPKSIEEQMIEAERAELLYKAVDGAFQRYKGGVSCSTTSMSSIFTKSPLWSIAPLRQYRNLLLLQRRK